jgi:hypothetical protein
MTYSSKGYADTAGLLREHMNDLQPDDFRDACVNRLPIILSALDLAASRTALDDDAMVDVP